MSSGSVAKRPDGQWRARYRDAAGKEHSKHFATKKAGQTWLDGIVVAKATGTYADPTRGRQSFRDLAERWFDSRVRWKETTRARNRSVLDGHVLPKWGDRRLDSIETEELQRWVNELLASGLSAGSVRKVAGVCSSVLTYATRTAKALGVSPMTGVELPAQTSARRRYLSPSEVERFAAAAGEHDVEVLTLAYTGLRFGELAALRVGDVDSLRRRIVIDESVTEVNGRLVWSTPKDNQVRRVPMPDFLLDRLAEVVGERGDDEMLFTSRRGEVLRYRNMRRSWFDRAAVEAGLAGLTPHELRHTAASIAVSAGASVLALQRMLGHEKPSVTLDVYADLFDSDLDALAETLSSARSAGLADYLRTSGAANVVPIRAAGA